MEHIIKNSAPIILERFVRTNESRLTYKGVKELENKQLHNWIVRPNGTLEVQIYEDDTRNPEKIYKLFFRSVQVIQKF